MIPEPYLDTAIAWPGRASRIVKIKKQVYFFPPTTCTKRSYSEVS